MPPWATLCNARGARDVPVAEWVVGALLGARYGAAARRRTAARRGRTAGPASCTATTRAHRRASARSGARSQARLAPFGAKVVGVASRARDGVHGIDELPDLLPRGRRGRRARAAHATRRAGCSTPSCSPRCATARSFVNAGRGAVVDTDALVAELERGRLRAVLDVTDPEPLPGRPPALGPRARDHAAQRRRLRRRRTSARSQLAAEQLGRFARGEPLRNVVRDKML